MYRPFACAFDNTGEAVRFARENASGPFTAFLKGWECFVRVRLDSDGGWKWDYGSYDEC